MFERHRSRQFGTVLLVVLTVSLAGCGLFGGGCGPGDTEIGEVSGTNGTVSVTGEVNVTEDNGFTITDGTGEAVVVSDEDVSEGDCVTVEGETSDTDGFEESEQIDALIAAEDVTVN